MEEKGTSPTKLTIPEDKRPKKRRGARGRMPVGFRDSLILTKEKSLASLMKELGPSSRLDSLEIANGSHRSLVLKLEQAIQAGEKATSSETAMGGSMTPSEDDISSSEEDDDTFASDSPEDTGCEKESNSGALPRQVGKPQVA